MSQIIQWLVLFVHVPRRVALKRLQTAHGTVAIDLGAVVPRTKETWLEAIARIGGEDAVAEIDRLAVASKVPANQARKNDEDPALLIGSVSFDVQMVVDALRDTREKRIKRLLAAIAENGFEPAAMSHAPDGEPYIAIEEDILRDPRVAACVVEHEEAAERSRVSLEATAQQLKQRHDRSVRGLRAYALASARLGRAARENYGVVRPALDEFEATVKACSPKGSLVVALADLKFFGEHKASPMPAPTAASFDVLDRILAAIGALDVPDGVDLNVSRICRLHFFLTNDPGQGFLEVDDEPAVAIVVVRIDPHLFPNNDERALVFYVDPLESSWRRFSEFCRVQESWTERPDFVVEEAPSDRSVS